MSATNVALFAAATGNAHNSAANIDAQKKACSASIAGYEHAGASIGQMQSYADCIRLLYPPDAPEGIWWAVLALVVGVLACALVGAMRKFREHRSLEEAMWGGVMYGLVVCLAFGLVVALVGVVLSASAAI